MINAAEFDSIVNSWNRDPAFDLEEYVTSHGGSESQIERARQIEQADMRARGAARRAARETFADQIGKPDPGLKSSDVWDWVRLLIEDGWSGDIICDQERDDGIVAIAIVLDMDATRNENAREQLARLALALGAAHPDLSIDTSGNVPKGVKSFHRYGVGHYEFRILVTRPYTEADLTRGDLFRYEVCDDVRDLRQHAEFERRVSAQLREHGWRVHEMRGHRDQMIVSLVRHSDGL